MSHDLRGSVRVVGMFAEALAAKSKKWDEESRQDLERIQWVAAEMRDLIDSLLNFSRLGRGEVRHTAIDPGAYIRSCMESLQGEIQTRKAKVHVKSRGGTVHADPVLLKIALTNLLSNAIKFVPEGVRPNVTVAVSMRGGSCRIEINDNGIGIAREHQQRIFLPFVRLHAADEVAGIGLGLPSVRKALELMGGRVGVRSRAGAGSTFWIEFPS